MISQMLVPSKKIGYILIEFGDLGPVPIYDENIPFDPEMMDVYGTQLGIYLSLVVGQGSNDFPLGLTGPYPWNNTPNHNLLIYTFKGDNPKIQDPRAISDGVVMLLVVFVPMDDNEILKARISIEQELASLLLKEKREDLLSVDIEEIPILIAQIKGKINKSISEGNMINQEQALDNLLNNASLTYLGLFNKETQQLIADIVGEAEDFGELISQAKGLTLDIFISSFQNYKFGIINIEKYNKFIVLILDTTKLQFFLEKEFLKLYDSIITSAPLLEEYYSF